MYTYMLDVQIVRLNIYVMPLCRYLTSFTLVFSTLMDKCVTHGSGLKNKTMQDGLEVNSQVYCWLQNIQKKIKVIEDPKGPNAIITCFHQLIKQTKSLHVLKSHWPLLAKLSTNYNLC